MNPPPVTKEKIIEQLGNLPPETLPELEAFIEFLRFKSEKERGEQARPEAWREVLAATFGMWAGRDDMPNDGVEYVQTIRRGHRLNDYVDPAHETD